ARPGLVDGEVEAVGGHAAGGDGGHGPQVVKKALGSVAPGRLIIWTNFRPIFSSTRWEAVLPGEVMATTLGRPTTSRACLRTAAASWVTGVSVSRAVVSSVTYGRSSRATRLEVSQRAPPICCTSA